MSTATVSGGHPLRGTARLPGDKSISHRALIFAALAEGTSVLRALSDGDDVVRTRAALQILGARSDGERFIGGRSLLRAATDTIDVGNSGTGMRLLAGVAASLAFRTVLDGDASIRRRPMERVVHPLRLMGARIDGRDEGRFAPLEIRGGALNGIDYSTKVPSAQVKSAILLAGLAACGETVVREPVETRPHTEELLALAGAPASIRDEGGDHVVRVSAALSPFEIEVPKDPSQAAFLVVAATIVARSEIRLDNVYVGPRRTGFLRVLERMGADIELITRGATTADLVVRSASLRATDISGDEVADAIDEIPILAVAAAFAEGTTTISGAVELRVKETDRIETMTSELSAIGVKVTALDDGMVIVGGRPRAMGHVRSHGDHRVAMALAVAGLVEDTDLVIDEVDAVATSWPSFFADLKDLACR